MQEWRQWLAALAAATVPAAHAGAYTDLWWNPQESGWGVNVVQQLETAFVTMFVYGADGKPTWYVAPNAQVTHYGTPGPIFGGTLYRTEGPFHAGPFDPKKVKAVVAGQVTLEVLARDRMRVYYSAEGSPQIVKEVVRQTWQQEMLAANYAGQFVLRQSRPGEPAYGSRIYGAEVLISAIEPEAFMRVDDHLGRRCEYRGPWQQTGKLARFTGTFSCSSGENGPGTFELSDIEVTAHGITGYLRTFSGVNETGRFSAARY